MKRAQYSYKDDKGHLFVDCAECNRGGNGIDSDKCACGWKIKRSKKLGCFLGELLDGLTIEK
jgi:hypothetical protein